MPRPDDKNCHLSLLQLLHAVLAAGAAQQRQVVKAALQVYDLRRRHALLRHLHGLQRLQLLLQLLCPLSQRVHWHALPGLPHDALHHVKDALSKADVSSSHMSCIHACLMISQAHQAVHQVQAGQAARILRIGVHQDLERLRHLLLL